MIDVLTTFNVGGAVQALNNQAQVARYLPGLAPGLVTDGQAAMIARAYGLQTTELAGFGGAFDGISDAASSIGSVDNTKSGFAPFFGGSESSSQQSPADAALGQFLLQNPLSQYGIYGNPLASSPPVGGVLLDTAATLVGQNLSDITGAMYDPVSGQFVFLGTNNVAPVKNINLDYLYTALQAVYGSAVPPFVTLNPSAQITSSASQTESLSVTVYPSGTYYGGLSGGTTHTLNGTFTSPFLDVYPYELLEYYGDPVGWDEGLYASVIIFPGDDAYATMPYSPIWPGEDTNVDVVLQGVDYGPELNQSGKFSWRARFNCVSNNLVFSQWIADAHDTIPSGGTMSFSPVPVAYGPYGETSYNLTFVNSSDYILISSAVAIPARQQRQFGGRVENTMVGWIMEEADRTMKCLWIGSNNITGAAYNSSTIHVSGYKNLFELYGNSTPTNCSVRNWFTPKLMTLQQYIDPNTGLASIVFSNATVLCQTENDLTGGASPQQDQAFCNNMTAQYDAFATNKFPCYDPTDPTGSRIIYTNIFGMLKDVMKAVSLARFFRDNNIPVDMWWLNSWQCPVAYTPKSVPTIVAYSANKTYTISGGVYIQLPNAYVASVTASNVAQLVQSSRPDAAGNSSGDIKQQVWTANTSVGNLTAVSLNSAGEPQDGNVNLAETDLAFASPGAMPLQFTRSYQSSWLGGDAMGPGWSYAPYELQFSRPSWYDDYGWMTDNYGDLLPVFPGTSDTGLRSDSLRVVNMSSGATLDFISSLVLGYAVDANNLPYITLNGLTADGVPMFTPGLRQNGSMLIQIADQREYQLFTPDGSVLVFDSNGKLLQIQDRNGWQQDYNYDNAGHLMSVTDDTQQSLVFTYDAQTNYLTSVIGPNGEQVNYTYTTNGCLAMAQHVRSGAYVSYQYNTNRQLIAKTLFNGLNVIQSQPDLKGRANTNMDVRGNSVIKTFTQGHAGTVRTNEIRDPQITDPKFVSRRLQRDRSGRLLASRTQTGAETSYGYNTNSLLPNTVALPIAGRPPITIQRDAYGRPTRITDPGNTNAQDVTATYDPDTTLLQQVTDEAGHATQLYYDGNQNLTDVQTALGTQNVNVNFGYSPSGSLSSIQNPLGITVVTMNRDNLNRVTNVVDATGVSINYQYDALGRLWKLIDPQLASPVVYVYDNFDRVIEIHLPAGTNYYTYDPKMGWLTSQTDLLGRTTRYDHDPNTGDIVQIVQIVPGGANLVTVMSYDRFGNLASVTPPGAGTISYNYDNSGRQVGSVQSGVGIPGTPISLTCNNATNGLPTIYTNFVFSWLPPVSSVGVAGYSYALDQMPASITNTLATNATINGVSVGTHLFQVSAQGTNGMWGPTADFLLVVTNVPGSIPPGAPPGLICDHATNDVPTCYTSFTFSWSVPTSQNGVAGYSYALDQAPPSSVSTTGTTATFANVSFGTHLFHVQALGANGIWGPTSDFVLLVAPAPAITPPDAPPGLTCDHATNGVQTYYTSFMFSWSVPNSHNGIAGYSYALDQIPLNSVLTTATNFAITNVSYGIHLFQVQAQDNNGLWGPTADFQLIVAWVPGTLPPGAPEVFCNLTVSGSPTTYTNFVFSWSVPFSENGIAGYSYGFDQDAPDAVLTLMNTAPVRNVSLGTHSFVVKALGSNGVWGAEGEFDLEVVQPPASSVPYGATAIIEGAPTCGSLVCGCLASMFDPGYTITTNNSGWMTYQGTMTNQISWEPSITIACNFQGSLTGINDLNNDPNNAYGQSTTIVVSDIDPPSDYPPYAPYYYDEEQIGVIPYVFVRNQALSGVNNISADEATLLFSSSGAVPGQPFHGMTASYLGGSSNSPIYLIGVNSSSGTRMQVENIVGFLGSSVYWASDGVSPYSITNGYPLESMIADLVARRPDAIGYVDYSNYKRCLGSVIAMRYNGVTCTTNTVANGSYELWGYARVISLSQMGSLQHQIYDALISNLNSASFQSSPVYRNALVPLSIMQVERDQDFGPIYPFLWGD
jgi:YD repeat-containing protein